jgi:hypothetical protein
MTDPRPEALILESHLYTEIAVSDPVKTLYLEFYQGAIDAYCKHCGQHSVFLKTEPRMPGRSRGGMALPPASNIDALLAGDSDFQQQDGTCRRMAAAEYARMDRIITLRFRCTRNPGHGELIFLFLVSASNITKIGQYPSHADLQEDRIKKYRGVLSVEHAREFSMALGLASHGVGIGAYVYLRRIFERLIEEAHQEAIKSPGWDESIYPNRWDERIASLKDFLPSFLVRIKSAYAILSKGLHELTEEECKQHFVILSNGIELILDRVIEEKERQRKEKETADAISRTLNGVRNSKQP